MHLVDGLPATQISVLDRGLLYGHSVFETIRVHQRQPLLLDAHMERLSVGCERLGLPLDSGKFEDDIFTLCEEHDEVDFVLRISQTMGAGGRGYQSPAQPTGTRVVSAYPLPDYPKSNWQEGIILGMAEIKLAQQPELAGIKHSNRLEQILARQQWQSSWQEAVVLDQQENVIEGTQSNLFIYRDNRLQTPDLSACGVAGVMRQTILDLAAELGLQTEIVRLSVADLNRAEEIFVSNSIVGLWPVKQFLKRQYAPASLAPKLLSHLITNEAIPPV